MPADLILHERNALALDGVCKDGLGLAGHGRLGERGLDGVKIVAVGQLDEVKAERAELGGQIAKAHDLVVRAVDLEPIVVDDDGQVVELIVRGSHVSLPDLTLLALAVADEVTTAEDIHGPWSDPIRVNGVGFDASLFHDDDGRKYLVQQTWDHREYHHAFDGITLTEFDTETMQLKPETARNIYNGTEVKLVEGPHLYKINGYYYLFAAQGGTVYTHQEVVARSKTLDELSFETEPDGPFITNFDTPYLEIQKQGHGALVDTPSGEWYYASLCGRPWTHENQCCIDPRGYCTLGRETAIQKVYWDEEGWPRIEGGHGGKVLVDAPKDAIKTDAPLDHSMHDEFDTEKLHNEWNTLRVPFTDAMGTTGDGKLTLRGQGSLSNKHELSLVAKRWQAFNFDASVKVSYNPFSYQQMAGLTNFYNDKHWSFAFITWNEKNGRVIEVAQCNRGGYTSFLRDDAIPVPDGADVWFRTKVRKQTYTYEYSFDGENYKEIPVTLDASILSDDYVLQSYGGFFTGAFVGMACVDYAGYNTVAEFRSFDYKEYED